MEKINKSPLRSLLTALILAVVLFNAGGQAAMPDALIKSPIKDQLKFIQERTKIFDNYRAIREDMFQKLLGNVADTITVAFNMINMLNSNVTDLRYEVDSLTAGLETTKASLETAIKTKNSIKLFGQEINKHTYNSIMWLIIAGLSIILVIGFISYRRSLAVAQHTEKELKDLKDEFQAYRKSAREAREKMSMDHFNELRKLRGG